MRSEGGIDVIRRRWTGWVLMAALVIVSGCSGQTGKAPEPGDQGSPQQSPPTQAASGPKKGGQLRIGLHRDPAILDPHVSQGASSVSVQGNIYDALVEYDANGQLQGALAERWEISEATVFTFYLRKGVTFQDGHPLTADDVIATFQRIGDSTIGATRKPTVDAMASYEAVDAHTVKVVLKEPNAIFLHELASNASYIVSAADVKNGFDFKNKTNGTGAFILESWEPNSRYNLVRNPNYWRTGHPYLDRVTFTPIIDDKARVNALRSGEVDFVEYVPWQETDALTRDYTVYQSGDAFNTVRLHQSKAPLDNKYLRQALNYIVDRDAMIDLAFGGLGTPITGPLQQPGSPYYVQAHEGQFKQDHAKALELIKKAGYNSPAEVPPIEFTVGVIAVHSETGQVVQQQLKDFGLTVNWKSVESVRNLRLPGDYVMMMDGLSMSWPDPDSLRAYFHSQGTGHAVGTKMSNKELDALLEQGSRTVNEAERVEIYRKAEAIILDEAPWIFLFWRTQADAFDKKLQGYVNIPGGLGGQSLNRLEWVWMDTK